MNRPSIRSRVGALAAALVVLCTFAPAVTDAAKLDRFLERKMNRAKVPGMATAVVVGDEVVQAKGYGWANIKDRVPVTSDTLFLLASVSKPVAATMAMQLVDRGLIELDVDINRYLTFEVRNPSFPDAAITLRQLLAHTSSISDKLFYDNLDTIVSDGDWPGSLTQFLIDYLTPRGRYYDPGITFFDAAPGTKASYSNIGYTLAGALVEAAAGIAFETVSQERLLGPLEMTESSWFLRDLDLSRIAVPYSSATRTFEALAHLGMATWPSGTLRTSSRQLANFALMHLNDGRFEGRRVLKRSSATEMFEIQFPDVDSSRAISFTILEKDGHRYAQHQGGVEGVTTAFWLSLNEEIAVVILMNGEAWRSPKSLKAFNKVRERLFKQGRRIARRGAD